MPFAGDLTGVRSGLDQPSVIDLVFKTTQIPLNLISRFVGGTCRFFMEISRSQELASWERSSVPKNPAIWAPIPRLASWRKLWGADKLGCRDTA